MMFKYEALYKGKNPNQIIEYTRDFAVKNKLFKKVTKIYSLDFHNKGMEDSFLFPYEKLNKSIPYYLVPQEATLFSTSLKNNNYIHFGLASYKNIESYNFNYAFASKIFPYNIFTKQKNFPDLATSYVSIFATLDFMKQNGVNIEVFDESDFWKTRNIEVLANSVISLYNGINFLKDAGIEFKGYNKASLSNKEIDNIYSFAEKVKGSYGNFDSIKSMIYFIEDRKIAEEIEKTSEQERII